MAESKLSLNVHLDVPIEIVTQSFCGIAFLAFKDVPVDATFCWDKTKNTLNLSLKQASDHICMHMADSSDTEEEQTTEDKAANANATAHFQAFLATIKEMNQEPNK